MLNEYRDIVSNIKAEDARFAKILERHNELDKTIADIDEGREHLDANALDKLKKEKLKLKDEAYAKITAYKKEKGL